MICSNISRAEGCLALSVSSEREGVDLMWVGDEALIESTHELILHPTPLMSRSLRNCLSVMSMNFPGIGGGLWAPEMANSDVEIGECFGSEMTTFCQIGRAHV